MIAPWPTRLLALAVLVAACTGCTTDQPATPYANSPAQDEVVESAALLAAAEAAPNDAARAPLLERLDALGVHAVDAAADDPLTGWRSAHRDGVAWRGRALGPAYRRARVAPGDSLVIEQVFLAGQRARIAAEISEGGNGAVALAISNPRAEPVCTRQLAPSASCTFLPIYTERFAIQLANHGREAASVYLVFR